MNPHLCMACWECVEKCPKQVIGKTGFFLHKHVVFENADACIGCLKCIKTCPNGVFFKLDKTVFDRKINILCVMYLKTIYKRLVYDKQRYTNDK